MQCFDQACSDVGESSVVINWFVAFIDFVAILYIISHIKGN